MGLETYTLLTVLNSSFEARAGGSSDFTWFVAAGGERGSPSLALRDLRMSMKFWNCFVITSCEDDWFVAGAEAISIARTALTMPMNCWI